MCITITRAPELKKSKTNLYFFFHTQDSYVLASISKLNDSKTRDAKSSDSIKHSLLQDQNYQLRQLSNRFQNGTHNRGNPIPTKCKITRENNIHQQEKIIKLDIKANLKKEKHHQSQTVERSHMIKHTSWIVPVSELEKGY